ncbi:hypothetical protein PHISCL_02456 [Aspergillus sclerotialis]|uniref:Uncharacterized protein n=1 Tax=Aspergillus sclerotialis TaxID=2070753 RepID=A0A3A2ZPT2_9EURO|nr:hypothetical protein PHISCL_02456 [Aspergillus sclerotialis]
MHSIPNPTRPTESDLSAFPTDGGGCRPIDDVQRPRPLNPRASLDDYNRVMLEYTKRRMSTFASVSQERHTSSSRSSSDSSEKSNDSSAGVLARQANASVHDTEKASQG